LTCRCNDFVQKHESITLHLLNFKTTLPLKSISFAVASGCVRSGFASGVNLSTAKEFFIFCTSLQIAQIYFHATKAFRLFGRQPQLQSNHCAYILPVN
jgi:hypothetical protein